MVSCYTLPVLITNTTTRTSLLGSIGRIIVCAQWSSWALTSHRTMILANIVGVYLRYVTMQFVSFTQKHKFMTYTVLEA